MSHEVSIPIPKPLGVTYYVVRFTRDTTPRLCCVCAGKRAIKVELGDGEIVQVACPECERGWRGCDGLESPHFEYGPWHYRVDAFTPDRVEFYGSDVSYFQAGSCVSEKAVAMHATREEAESEKRKREDRDAAEGAKGRIRSRSTAARAVGFLVKRRKELREELARYEEMLRVRGVDPQEESK